MCCFFVWRWEMRNETWDVRNGRWEMRDERWEMRDERWEMRNEKWEMRNERNILIALSLIVLRNASKLSKNYFIMGCEIVRREKWEMRGEKCEMRDERWEMRDEKDERWEMRDDTCTLRLDMTGGAAVRLKFNKRLLGRASILLQCHVQCHESNIVLVNEDQCPHYCSIQYSTYFN